MNVSNVAGRGKRINDLSDCSIEIVVTWRIASLSSWMPAQVAANDGVFKLGMLLWEGQFFRSKGNLLSWRNSWYDKAHESFLNDCFLYYATASSVWWKNNSFGTRNINEACVGQAMILRNKNWKRMGSEKKIIFWCKGFWIFRFSFLWTLIWRWQGLSKYSTQLRLIKCK